MNEVINNIKNEILENDVVLYMKGTSSMPQCGFSSRVAGKRGFKRGNKEFFRMANYPSTLYQRGICWGMRYYY